MSTKFHAESPGLSRVVEKQMRKWELHHAQHPEADPSSKAAPVSEFITLSNSVGAGGDDIAATLSARLGWPVFGREILLAMAGDDEVRARLYRSMDERDIGWFEQTFRCLMQQEFRKNDYFHRLTEAILCIVRRGHAILVGRGADLILPREHGLRVKLIAPLRRRIENFARRTGTTLEHAAAEIQRIEQDRRAFIQRDFHADADTPARFDLLINVDRFTCDQAVELILVGLRMRTGWAPGSAVHN